MQYNTSWLLNNLFLSLVVRNNNNNNQHQHQHQHHRQNQYENPAGAMHGQRLGEAAHRLVVNSIQVRRDRDSYTSNSSSCGDQRYQPYSNNRRHDHNRSGHQQYVPTSPAGGSYDRSHSHHSSAPPGYRQPYESQQPAHGGYYQPPPPGSHHLPNPNSGHMYPPHGYEVQPPYVPAPAPYHHQSAGYNPNYQSHSHSGGGYSPRDSGGWANQGGGRGGRGYQHQQSHDQYQPSDRGGSARRPPPPRGGGGGGYHR